MTQMILVGATNASNWSIPRIAAKRSIVSLARELEAPLRSIRTPMRVITASASEISSAEYSMGTACLTLVSVGCKHGLQFLKMLTVVIQADFEIVWHGD